MKKGIYLTFVVPLLKTFQTCKIYRYDGAMELGTIKRKLEAHVGHVHSHNGVTSSNFHNFEITNDTLVFSIDTEKEVIMSDKMLQT